jgi:succinyl-CoA synthetase beta subunit
MPNLAWGEISFKPPTQTIRIITDIVILFFEKGRSYTEVNPLIQMLEILL